MSKQEITKRIEILERQIFFMEMADHMTCDELFAIDDKYNEIRKLKKELEEMN